MAIRLPDLETPAFNPIELAEEVMTHREVPFDRPLEDELVAELTGHWCNYRLWLSWEESLGALMLTSSYDIKIPEQHRALLYPLVARINENVLLGHFDISSEDGTVSYRYGQLATDSKAITQTLLEELIDIAAAECERFYPAFQTVLWGGQNSEDALKLVLFVHAGEA
ncbi:MAG: YbjN domain-containing protein [Rickettsiales bacterium]|nr:YbjN domain-containing protein [Rickettsiales bacterium]